MCIASFETLSSYLAGASGVARSHTHVCFWKGGFGCNAKLLVSCIARREVGKRQFLRIFVGRKSEHLLIIAMARRLPGMCHRIRWALLMRCKRHVRRMGMHPEYCVCISRRRLLVSTLLYQPHKGWSKRTVHPCIVCRVSMRSFLQPCKCHHVPRKQMFSRVVRTYKMADLVLDRSHAPDSFPSISGTRVFRGMELRRVWDIPRAIPRIRAKCCRPGMLVHRQVSTETALHSLLPDPHHW